MAQTYSLTFQSSQPAICGTAIFPPDFTGFDGHFPGAPLLPGFMHIQAALDLLNAAGIQGDLQTVHSAKFKRPILPGYQVLVELSPTESGQYDVTLSMAGEVCSHFHLGIASRPATQEAKLAVR